MTRFDGYRLLACPLCDKVHAKANLVTFNLMAFENWSDGRSVHSLFDNRQGLRKCTGCEDFFLESDATFIGRISSLEAERQVDPHDVDIPAFLRRDADGEANPKSTKSYSQKVTAPSSWWSRFKAWCVHNPQHDAYRQANVDTSSENEEPRPSYPRLQSVFDSDLASILERQDKYSDQLLIAARLLYWMYLNDPFRDTARGFIKKGKDPSIAFRPTDLQIDNMRSLLALMEQHPESYQETIAAELHRELGEFEKAINLLGKRSRLSQEDETIIDAARKGISAPVRIIYDHQKMN